MEPLILISHGYMPTHPVVEAGYTNPAFICPANVTIHYFEKLYLRYYSQNIHISIL